MIEILPAPIHVAAFRISGKLTAADFDRIYGEVDTKLKSHARVGLYTEAEDLAGITPRGLAKDLAFAFGRLGELHRFARGAVVTDRSWLRAVTEVENAILRRIELRAFGTTERAAAMNWVAELRDEPRIAALRVIPTTRHDTIAFAINGTITAEDAADFVSKAEPVLARNERVRLLGRIGPKFGISVAAFKDSGLRAFKWRARHKVDRYAVIGGPRWLPTWIAMLRAVIRIDLRHFDAREEAAAWVWIDAQPSD